MEPAIEVIDLRKTYDGVPAVDGISFRVAQAEVFGLLGPNGAGKTTTVECLLGLRQADSGSLRLLGDERGAQNLAIRGRLGVQLQTTGLLSQLTVREQVALFAGLFPRRVPAAQVLEAVGLADRAGAATKALSGGQKQRLAVALALVNDPDLVFLDEPTTGLDPQARRALWEVIRGLRERGRSVLLTTHYMEEAEQLCDRVAIIDHGRIIELDSPEALIRKHFREQAIEFVPSGAAPRPALESIAAVAQVLSQNGGVTLFSTDVPATMAGLFKLVSQGTLAFDDITVRRATLEDVFLKLTGRRIRS
ncbi:MAG: ABC transporter [Chloroflexi bacterium RBG_13_68_17]|nr:MAG: ABC transporter [Chloroflexi bacterium RBG_13_68_17]